MSDTNLCINFKAANVVLCVNHSAPEFLAKEPIGQNQICFMRHADCLPVRAHMLIQLCVNKEALCLLVMLQNQPEALGKWLVEGG